MEVHIVQYIIQLHFGKGYLWLFAYLHCVYCAFVDRRRGTDDFFTQQPKLLYSSCCSILHKCLFHEPDFETNNIGVKVLLALTTFVCPLGQRVIL